jgi:hypothetical protein
VKDLENFLQRRKKSIEKPPYDERMRAAVGLQATAIVEWVRGQPRERWNELTTRGICGPLTWAIHAQQQEGMIWDWLLTEARLTRAARGDAIVRRWGEEMPWALRVLGSLIDSHISWSRDHNLDSAIQQMQRAVSIFMHKPLDETVPLVGAGVALATALRRPETTCSPEPFMWFWTCIPVWEAKDWARGQHQSDILLCHPTRPDPMPWYKWMQKITGDATEDGQYIYNHPDVKQTAQNAIDNMCIRAAYIFRLKGDHERAHWLDCAVEKYRRPVWHKHEDIAQQTANDHRLRELQAEALEAGRPLPFPGPEYENI